MKVINYNNAFNKSLGYKIYRELNGLGISKKILDRNYYWLLQLKKYIEIHRELLWVKNGEKMEDFQIEFSRHLHNYLASVKTLVDHTRTFNKKLKLDNEFKIIYQEKRIYYLGTDTIIFIQQLREYCQHYQLLPVGVSVNIRDKYSEEIITLILSTKTLLEFKDWKAGSKNILDTNKDNIDIYKLMEEYQSYVNKFYKWFYEYLNHLYVNELLEFNKLRKEYIAHFQ